MSQITSQVGALLAPLLFIILLVTESLEAGALQSKLRLHSRAIRATPDSMPANQIHQPVTSKQSYSKIPSMNGDTMMMNQPMIDERGGNDGSPIVESHNIEAEIFSPLRDLEKKGFVDSVIYNPLKVIEMLNTLMHDIAWSVLMKVNSYDRSWALNGPKADKDLFNMREQFERLSLDDTDWLLKPEQEVKAISVL